MELVMVLFSALLGLAIGSFLNVVVLRLHAEDTLGGRSHCPNCKTILPWYTLMPVGSYIWLRGKCRFCSTSISLQYPLVEAATAAVFIWIALQYASAPLQLVMYWVLASIAIAIFVYDYLYMQIPDIFSLAGLALSVIFQFSLGMPWWSIAVGILIGAGVFVVQYAVSGGRWVGSGDIRLGAFIGAATGWPNVLAALFLAYVSGAVVALVLLCMKRKQMADALPFGTFLTAGLLLALLYGDQLVAWYLYGLIRIP